MEFTFITKRIWYRFLISRHFSLKKKRPLLFFLSFSYSINIITTSSSSSTPFFHITNVFLTILSKIKQKKGVICTRAYVHIKLVFDRKQIFFLNWFQGYIYIYKYACVFHVYTWYLMILEKQDIYILKKSHYINRKTFLGKMIGFLFFITKSTTCK